MTVTTKPKTSLKDLAPVSDHDRINQRVRTIDCVKHRLRQERDASQDQPCDQHGRRDRAARRYRATTRPADGRDQPGDPRVPGNRIKHRMYTRAEKQEPRDGQ
ncbi:hypothetical protein N8Y93_02295 [Litorivicinus sp.]|nr:hypothetical protein [Litorivicinus sp.]